MSENVEKEVVDMPRLFELKNKGFRNQTIALILGVSIDTIRTIIGGREYEVDASMREEIEEFRRCA